MNCRELKMVVARSEFWFEVKVSTFTPMYKANNPVVFSNALEREYLWSLARVAFYYQGDKRFYERYFKHADPSPYPAT